jgi:hypothetical protein
LSAAAIEIHPEWGSPAQSVTQMRDMPGFELKEAGTILQLVHNATAGNLDYKNPGPQARVFRSGQYYRAAWLDDGGQPEPVSSHPVERLAAHSHIVFSQKL